MAEITLARVDDRLVHGQVMQVWTKGHGHQRRLRHRRRHRC